MNACQYDPTVLAGQPIGMLHCPECGVMILAGQPHPPVRRYAPRRQRQDPWLDITDRPDLWSDEDEFDYHTNA